MYTYECVKLNKKHSFFYAGKGEYQCKYCPSYFQDISWHMRQVLLEPGKFLYLEPYPTRSEFVRVRVGTRV